MCCNDNLLVDAACRYHICNISGTWIIILDSLSQCEMSTLVFDQICPNDPFFNCKFILVCQIYRLWLDIGSKVHTGGFECFSLITANHTLMLSIYQSVTYSVTLISFFPGSLLLQLIPELYENQLAETWNLLKIVDPLQEYLKRQKDVQC